MMKKRAILWVTAMMLILPGMVYGDSVTPSTFDATLTVGESVTITKTVTVSETGTSMVDVFFLADTTGSMNTAISSVIASASSILSSTAALGDLAFGVGEYKDSYDAYRYRLNTDITTDQSAAQAGINMWSASGGGDAPEANLYALEQVADTTSWREGSERIVIWFGDAPGHDPDGGATETSATAALVDAGIQVEAINITTFSSLGFDLDTCTNPTYCSGGSEGGPATSGQATRITDATGGHLYTSTNTSAIVSVIQDAIASAIENYTEVGLDISEVPTGVTVTTSPAYVGTYDRSVERTFDFDVTFTADAEGTYDFSIYGTVDGGRIGTEIDHIEVAPVPEPSTYLLLGTGLLGLAFFRRKERF